MKIYLAPMEGVVDFVIRQLFSQIGGYDQMVTEFVRVTQQLLPDHVFYRYCPELKTGGKTRHGTPVYVQLLGGSPSVLAENAAKAVALGAPGIDLNFGCPAKTVNRHDGGATLLKHPERLFHIISAVKSACPNQPVTAKVRLGFADKSLVKEIAQAVGDARAERLTIHARTKLEGYKPPAHWEYIAIMREEVSIPVVANGDIWTLKDYLQCRKITGCKQFALGRGAFSAPELANTLQAYEAREEFTPKEWQEVVKDYVIPFVHHSFEFAGERYAINRCKQWVKFLGRTFPQAAETFERLKLSKNLNDIFVNLGHRWGAKQGHPVADLAPTSPVAL